MAGATPSITSILPDEGWAPRLAIIVQEAPAQSVIEVNTVGMQALATRMLQEVGRQDVTVALRPPPGRALASAAGNGLAGVAHGPGPADCSPPTGGRLRGLCGIKLAHSRSLWT